MPIAIKMNDTDPPHWIRHAKTAGMTLAGASSAITMWAIVYRHSLNDDICFMSSSVGDPITACNYWFGLDTGTLCFKKWDTAGAALRKYVGTSYFPAGNNQTHYKLWYQDYMFVAVSYTSGDGNVPEFWAGLIDNQNHQTDDGGTGHGIGSTRLYYQSGGWDVTPTTHDMADDSSDYVYIGRDSAGSYMSLDSNSNANGNLAGYGMINEHVLEKASAPGTELFNDVAVEYYEMPRFIEDIDDWATNGLPAMGQYPETWKMGGAKYQAGDASGTPTDTHDGEIIGEGDGSTAEFTRTVDHILIEESSVTITAAKSGGTMTVTDDGGGALVGDVDGGGNNTVDYETGEIDVTFDNNVTDGAAVEMAYTFHSNHQLFVFFERQSADWDYSIRNHCAADIFDKTDTGHGTAYNGAVAFGTAGTFDTDWYVKESSNNILLTEGGGSLRRELPQENAPADIQCHTTGHAHMGLESRDYVLDVYERLDSMFRERGLTAPLHTAYPNGTYNDQLKVWTSERRLSGRTAAVVGAAAGINRYPMSTDPTDPTDGSGSCWFELACHQCHQLGADLPDAMTYVDSMSGTLGLYLMYSHGLQRFPFDVYHSDPSLQKELIQYAIDAGVRIVDLVEAYRLIEQEAGGTLTESLLVWTFDDEYPGAIQYAYRYLARMAGVGGTYYVSDAAMQGAGNWAPNQRTTYDDLCAAAGLPISHFTVRFLNNGAAKTGLYPRAVSGIVTGSSPGYPRVTSADGLYQAAPHQGFTELHDGYYSMPVCGGLARQINVHSMNFEMADDELEIPGIIPTTLTQRGFVSRDIREEIEQAVRIRVDAQDIQVDVVKISGDGTAADNLEAVLDGSGISSDVDITMRSLDVTNDAGTGVKIQGTTIGLDVDGSNGVGIDVDGTTHGMIVTGAAGRGIWGLGGANGPGIEGVGAGAGAGIYGFGGGSEGSGIKAVGGATNGIGMQLMGQGTGQDIDATEIEGVVLVQTTINTLASQTSFTLAAASADNDAYNDCEIIIQDATTAVQKARGLVKDYVGSSKTITLTADPGIFTMAIGDTVTILASATVASIFGKTGLTTTGTISFGEIIKMLNSMAHCKFTKSGSTLLFYDDDGTTLLYTVTVNEGTGRTVVDA